MKKIIKIGIVFLLFIAVKQTTNISAITNEPANNQVVALSDSDKNYHKNISVSTEEEKTQSLVVAGVSLTLALSFLTLLESNRKKERGICE